MDNTIKKHRLSFEAIIIIVSVLTVLIPLAIYTAISLRSSSNTIINIIQDELTEQTILISTSIDSFIAERIVDAKTISQSDALESNDLDKKIQYLTEIVAENAWIDDIDIVNTDGVIIASSGIQNEQGLLLWGIQPSYKTIYNLAVHAKQGQVFVSNATQLDNGPGVLFLTPITDDTNKIVISLLAIEVSLQHFSKAINTLNQGKNDHRYIYIVDNGGKIISSNNAAVTFAEDFPNLTENPELLNAFSQQGKTGSLIYTKRNGESVMAAYDDMGEFGANKALDWSLIIVEPIKDIIAPVNKLKDTLLITSFIILFFGVFMAYWLTNIYRKALQKVAARADDIANGIYAQGSPVIIKRRGALYTLVGAFNRMEANLKESINLLKDREQRLDIMLNSIGDGVIATDQKGHITRMNPTSEKLTGWKFSDAKGKAISDIFEIIDETTRTPIKNPVEKVIETGVTVFLNNHTTLLSKDGPEYQIEDSAAAIMDEDNNIHGMILIFSDVTRRKEAEQRYRRAIKMDALGKLTGGIAHDYNNILGIIIGYSELVIEKADNQPELIMYANTIQQSAERGASLTKKLLDFSRHKIAEEKQLNINTILQEQMLMLQKTLTVRIELKMKLEENLWSSFFDESDFIDVLLNLSINAMHAIKQNGTITFFTNNVKINALDAMSSDLVAGDYVELSIADTGCGMDKSICDKIFDPFFSTKGKKGTGLGLSQVYGFMKRSKGSIEVSSKKDLGTKFTLLFPRYHDTAKNNAPQTHEPTQDDFKKLAHTQTILVVDDEPELGSFCCMVLEEYGFNILSATSAKEALKILEKESVDALLSDVIMPEMNGYELAEIVKRQYPEIKIQLASGFSSEEPENNHQALKENMLYKPYRSEQLLQTVIRLLKQND